MLLLENIEIGMKVYALNSGVGIVKDLWLSDANRCYSTVDFEKVGLRDIPIAMLIKY